MSVYSSDSPEAAASVHPLVSPRTHTLHQLVREFEPFHFTHFYNTSRRSLCRQLIAKIVSKTKARISTQVHIRSSQSLLALRHLRQRNHPHRHVHVSALFHLSMNNVFGFLVNENQIDFQYADTTSSAHPRCTSPCSSPRSSQQRRSHSSSSSSGQWSHLPSSTSAMGYVSLTL